MNQKELQKFISYLVDNYQVFAPQEEEKKVIIKEISSAKTAALTSQLPFFSWKKFFVPEKEIMFSFKNSALIQNGAEKSSQIALLGVNILDLRSILLYDAVFANDPYYQKQRKNTLIIGYGPEVKLTDGALRKIETEDLKCLPFDIFLYNINQGAKDQKYNIFSATEKGKKILSEIDYKDYTEIKFIGHKYNSFLEEKKNLRREKLKNNHIQKIWDELGKICLECGKCAIACPTCFCFKINDCPELTEGAGERARCWDSCFYSEFSEVAGPVSPAGEKPKFLKNTAQKIHFWYYHKFARIPDEYNMMGCVGCHRCVEVCPVGINIEKVMEEVEKS